MILGDFINIIKKLKIDFNESIKCLIFPADLTILIFGDEFNQPLGSTVGNIPSAYLPNLELLTHLKFGNSFNQEIGDWINIGVEYTSVYFLPQTPTLKKIWFGNNFICNIRGPNLEPYIPCNAKIFVLI